MHVSQNGAGLLIWIIVFTVVCTIILGLRFWAASVAKRRIQADDYFVCLAYASTLALAGTAIWGVANGLGDHTNRLTEYELSVQFKLILSAGVTWLIATVFLKLSIVLLYRRIFTTPAFRKASLVAIIIIVAYGVAFLPVFMTQCTPIDQQWNPVPWGSCRDVTIQELASVSINMAIDMMILILPLPPLWGLQMATRNKAFISSLFSLGILTVGIMAWRIQATQASATNPDFVFIFGTIALISFLELWIGHIIACVPTLAPLIKKYVSPTVVKVYKATRTSGIRLPKIGKGRSGIATESVHDDSAYLRLHDEQLQTSKSGGAYAMHIPTNKSQDSNPTDQIRVQHDVEVTFADR